MNGYHAFHKSVKGYLHIKKGISCEDASESWSEENGEFHIAAIADGHGDYSCIRSKEGARMAVETARDCLMVFAREMENEQAREGYLSIKERMAIDKYQKAILRQLTDTIIFRWFSAVEEDLRKNPLTEEEIGKAEGMADAYRRGESLVHAYGTTLIAALMVPDYLILIQQGDGRCVVFYEDGIAGQAIPWDDRCHENITTSMCDKDVADSIRTQVVDLREKRVIACYLGSDGVEDSYRNMEGTYMFYRRLSCEWMDRGMDGFKSWLADILPDFSRKGSGDDVSVAGIADASAMESYVSMFRLQMQQYELEESLADCENRKISMERKHGILNKRLKKAETFLSEKQRLYEAERGRYQELVKNHEEAIINVEHALNIWREELRKKQRYEDIPVFDNGERRSRQVYLKYNQQERRLDEMRSLQEGRMKALKGEEEEARRQYQDAKEEFDVYDQTYQAVILKMEEILDKLEELGRSAEIRKERTLTGKKEPEKGPELEKGPEPEKEPEPEEILSVTEACGCEGEEGATCVQEPEKSPKISGDALESSGEGTD